MIYTKTGDKGTTSLVGGSRISKDDVRVEAYGTVDELNSMVGLVRAMVQDLSAVDAEMSSIYEEQLSAIQNDLFVVQTLLATENESVKKTLPVLDETSVNTLEHWIDQIQNDLPALKAFVIPGGTKASATCHVARCVCRRAERRMVTLSKECSVDGLLMSYINRLSDYLFVLARLLNLIEQKGEIFWQAK